MRAVLDWISHAFSGCSHGAVSPWLEGRHPERRHGDTARAAGFIVGGVAVENQFAVQVENPEREGALEVGHGSRAQTDLRALGLGHVSTGGLQEESLSLAAVTWTANRVPWLSTATWRERPLIFLPP